MTKQQTWCLMVFQYSISTNKSLEKIIIIIKDNLLYFLHLQVNQAMKRGFSSSSLSFKVARSGRGLSTQVCRCVEVFWGHFESLFGGNLTGCTNRLSVLGVKLLSLIYTDQFQQEGAGALLMLGWLWQTSGKLPNKQSHLSAFLICVVTNYIQTKHRHVFGRAKRRLSEM